MMHANVGIARVVYGPKKLPEPQPTKERHCKVIRFGLDDTFACPECGGLMHLTRRRPHPIRGDAFEMQTFTCRICNREIQRGIDHLGEAA